MDSEDKEETDEESDDYDIYKAAKIIKVDDEYELKNGLLGLKRDIIIKLKTPMNKEDKLKKLFCIYYEMSVIKSTPLFKRLRYFPPILEINHGQLQQDCDYEIRGNREFVSKEFMTHFIINFKMYKRYWNI
jgi:hypothetical protein